MKTCADQRKRRDSNPRYLSVRSLSSYGRARSYRCRNALTCRLSAS
jgi:hypothetical protein